MNNSIDTAINIDIEVENHTSFDKKICYFSLIVIGLTFLTIVCATLGVYFNTK